MKIADALFPVLACAEDVRSRRITYVVEDKAPSTDLPKEALERNILFIPRNANNTMMINAMKAMTYEKNCGKLINLILTIPTTKLPRVHHPT